MIVVASSTFGRSEISTVSLETLGRGGGGGGVEFEDLGIGSDDSGVRGVPGVSAVNNARFSGSGRLNCLLNGDRGGLLTIAVTGLFLTAVLS